MSEYVLKPLKVQAVQFNGSSTQASAIEKWVEEGGEYVEPGVQTRDIITIKDLPVTFPEEGFVDVSSGDYVVLDWHGRWAVYEAEGFEDVFMEVSGPEPLELDRVEHDYVEGR